jgi:hypothetical protein
MSITNLFSKRQKRLRGDFPDVYQYTDISGTLRVQIVHILREALYSSAVSDIVFESVQRALCAEYGMWRLSNEHDNPADDVLRFFVETADVEKALDVIELSFCGVANVYEQTPTSDVFTSPADIAISDLNTRFREHGVGFQFEAGQIIRVDSQLIHSEIVKPALELLSAKHFAGANQEFLSAHAHYRAGKYKECLNDCLKTFESTMKAICAKRKWPYKPSDTAKSLLDVVFAQDLVPTFMQSHFMGLRATLEGGIPTVRNRLGGHGQGLTPVTVPESIASYVLHLTATTVVFFAKAEAEMK